MQKKYSHWLLFCLDENAFSLDELAFKLVEIKYKENRTP